VLARHRLSDGREVLVRQAVESDAAALLDNINSVGAEDVYLLVEQGPSDLEAERAFIRGFDGKEGALFVAVTDGRVVGQADARRGAFPKNGHTATLGIAIRDKWRGVGLGRLLMETILDWMRDRGIEKACLEVFHTNERAIALYRSMGFEEEGRRRGQFRVKGKPVDDVLMAKWLR